MKPLSIINVIVCLSLTGCVSINKYNHVVDANTRQRQTIEKLNKKIRTLETRNNEMRDSLTLYGGEVLKMVVPGKRKEVVIKRTDGIEISNDSFQSEQEKAILYYMNYARVKPQEFLRKHVLPHLSDTSGYYRKTLIETLRKMQPVEPLKASQKMHSLAYCHAKSSGITGYVGHGRDKEQCNVKGHYNAECCAYGHAGYCEDEALNYVLQLLVDEGVPSLGHREIILMGWLKTAGVSIQPHKTYDENVVIDFGSSL